MEVGEESNGKTEIFASFRSCRLIPISSGICGVSIHFASAKPSVHMRMGWQAKRAIRWY
jgi:hypothetical protein